MDKNLVTRKNLLRSEQTPIKSIFYENLHPTQNQFIVICVDEEKEAASGCSIDALGQVMREIDAEFQLGLFDRMKASFVENGEVKTMKLQDFRKGLKEGEISQDIEVFDFSKNTYVAFLSDFLMPLKKSWAGIYVD